MKIFTKPKFSVLPGITALAVAITFSLMAAGFAALSLTGCDTGNDTTHTHTWGAWTETDAATCTEPAKETRVCSGDATHTETRDNEGSPALGHIAPGGTPATCTIAGNTGTGTCTRENCTETFTGETIPALGHTKATEPHSTTPASCLANGTQTYRCVRYDDCKHTFPAEEGDPALGHDFTGVWLKDASQHWKECTRCTAISGNGTTESVKANHFFLGGVCVCGETGFIDPDAAFFGTWIRTQGNYQPYTITITNTSFRFEDKDGDFINFDSITWAEAANTATVHGASGYTGIFTEVNSNPSLSYPNGFIIHGTKTLQGWNPSFIPDGFFIALSTDGQTLYVAESSSVYNRARFNNAEMSDSIFTRVSP